MGVVRIKPKRCLAGVLSQLCCGHVVILGGSPVEVELSRSREVERGGRDEGSQ
jgi:hypothetical protein